ncbi:hypothetical protein [Lysobacter gummosus]|uniref:hypothetical protein n=1 Tax=Lysobacter gummosus TaxID=262324 RepID=UPI00362896BD
MSHTGAIGPGEIARALAARLGRIRPRARPQNAAYTSPRPTSLGRSCRPFACKP